MSLSWRTLQEESEANNGNGGSGTSHEMREHDHSPDQEHGHSHGHEGHGHSHDAAVSEPLATPDASRSKAARALFISLGLCIVFMLIELVFGILSHSLALITDAAHLLTDVGAISISLIALHLAQKSADDQYTYGWHRAEVIGAFASVMTIWALVAIILFEACQRFYNYVQCKSYGDSDYCEAIDGKTMIIVGSIGLVMNIAVAGVLSLGGAGHGHSHGGGGHAEEIRSPAAEEGAHGHSHSHSHGNLNVRGAFLHALGDCVQSVGVIIAALIIWIGNVQMYGTASVSDSPFNLADPACSILFAIITLFTTRSLFRQLLSILMETVPQQVDYTVLHRELCSIGSVEAVHDLHVWSITADKMALSVHIVSVEHLAALRSAQDICKRHGIKHTTIQVDAPDTHVEHCGSDLTCRH